MCRLLYYNGKRIKLKTILIDPSNSLWNQSINANRNKWFKFNKRDHVINVDGFGLGWFDEEEEKFVIYKNTIIPYHDVNINNLSNFIKSRIICGHLRAVKNHKNCKVNRENCHPFSYKNILFMHNGLISNFCQYKQKLYKMINSQYYDKMEGNTDTEYIFYYYLTLLQLEEYGYNREHFLRCFMVMLDKLKKIFVGGTISANIVIVTPEFTIASRYINTSEEPPSLYLHKKEEIVISSEPLEEGSYDLIEKNSCLFVEHRDRSLKVVKL